MDINKAMSICFKNRIEVKPIIEENKIFIAYYSNGKLIKKYDKPVNSKDAGESISKVYIYLANKL